MDDFFYYASRIIIIIPIIIIIAGLIVKFNKKSISLKKVFIAPTVLPSPTLVPPKIDLNGPWICHNRQASISAYIKDKKVFAQNIIKEETINYLLNGDCVYIWKKNSNLGEKICGLSPYLRLIEVFGVASVFAKIPDFKIKEAVDLCRKQEITDLNIFNLPKDVMFK